MNLRKNLDTTDRYRYGREERRKRDHPDHSKAPQDGMYILYQNKPLSILFLDAVLVYPFFNHSGYILANKCNIHFQLAVSDS